jgi:hypothetical protein
MTNIAIAADASQSCVKLLSSFIFITSFLLKFGASLTSTGPPYRHARPRGIVHGARAISECIEPRDGRR